MSAPSLFAEQELIDSVHAARNAATPLSIIGSGTKSQIGRPAQSDKTLSTSALTGVTLHEPAEMVIAARSGTPLAEVERRLADKKQMLPFEPMDYRPLLGSAGEPTIGGVVAANLSGPRRIMAGACRDSLIGVRLVNGKGELVKSGGRVMKNVTGLDLVKLVCGSWGTLGVLTEVTFKVLPKPQRSATLVLHGLDDANAIAALSAGLGSPFEVSGAAHLPNGVERVSATLLRLEGFDEQITYRLDALKKQLNRFAAADYVEGARSAALWHSVRDVTFLVEPRENAVWRISIAPSKAAKIIAEIKKSLTIRHFYDWGGGLIWLSLPATGDAGAAAIRSALFGTGGYATLVRGPADIRAAIDVFEPLSPALRVLTAGIKQSFDPDGLFNPGRMIAGI